MPRRRTSSQSPQMSVSKTSRTGLPPGTSLSRRGREHHQRERSSPIMTMRYLNVNRRGAGDAVPKPGFFFKTGFLRADCPRPPGSRPAETRYLGRYRVSEQTRRRLSG